MNYLSVILSTYNSPQWLEKVLWGYQMQTYRFFEVIIADDGSDQRTKDLIDSMRKEVFYPINHIWHEDKGFQKTKILNKAVIESNSNYLIFSDGDCIPREDFVITHYQYREEGYFLSGGYHKLNMNLSNAITKENIINGDCFDIDWLKEKGMKLSFKNNKLSTSTIKSYLFNHLTTTDPTWNGHNSSGWKEDILNSNGFDERMKYGGEDRELGERLENNGVMGKQIRYSAICIHLDHARSYINKEDLERNNKIRKYTRLNKIMKTDYGIYKD